MIFITRITRIDDLTSGSQQDPFIAVQWTGPSSTYGLFQWNILHKSYDASIISYQVWKSKPLKMLPASALRTTDRAQLERARGSPLLRMTGYCYVLT
jgi:hypothetical protein